MGELLYVIKAGPGSLGTEGDGCSSQLAAGRGVPCGGGPQEHRSLPERGSQEGSAHRLQDEGGASAGSPART